MPTTTTARLPCALCALPADLHCPSDAATLCFRCDAKVHAANFLVARHARVLLCADCSAPTPWSASGARLTAAGARCGKCEEEGEGEGEEEGEEQVVPWKDGMGTPPPGEGEGESGEEEEEGRRRKRRRRGEEEDDQEDFPSVSSEPSLAEAATDEARATNVLRATKDKRRVVNKFHLEEDSRNNISQSTVFTLSGSGTPSI